MNKKAQKKLIIAAVAIAVIVVIIYFVKKSKLNSSKALMAAETEAGPEKFLKYLETYLSAKELQSFKHWSIGHKTDSTDRAELWTRDAEAEALRLGIPVEVALWRGFLWQMVEQGDLSRAKWDNIVVDSLALYGVA